MDNSGSINMNSGEGITQKSADPTILPLTITFGSLPPVQLNFETKFVPLQVHDDAIVEEESSPEVSLPVIEDALVQNASVEMNSGEASQPVVIEDTQVENASVEEENSGEASQPATEDTVNAANVEVNSRDTSLPRRRMRKRILWTYEEEKMLKEGVEACLDEIVKNMPSLEENLGYGKTCFSPYAYLRQFERQMGSYESCV